MFWFRSWPSIALAVLLGIVVLAAACGDDDDDAPAATTPGSEATATVQATPAPDVPGVSDDEIVLGAFTSLTGPAAAYAVLPKASQAYFEYINSQGGVYGRDIRYILCDDAFDPTQSVLCSKQLVEQDEIFAAFCNLGGGGNTAAMPYLDEQGVPNMFICANNAEFVNPLTGTNRLHFLGAPTYFVDGEVISGYVLDSLADKKVGLLVQTTGFGQDVEASVRDALGSEVEIVGTETAESADADLTSQVLNLKGAGAEVVVVAVLAHQGANAITVAAQQGWNPTWIVAEAGTEGLLDLIDDASISNGIVRTAEFREFGDTSDPNVKQWRDRQGEYGDGSLPFGQATAYGWCRAEMIVEALSLAGPNLTRDGLIEATEQMGEQDWACSLWLPGLTAAFSSDSHEALSTTMLQKADGGKWSTLE